MERKPDRSSATDRQGRRRAHVLACLGLALWPSAAAWAQATPVADAGPPAKSAPKAGAAPGQDATTLEGVQVVGIRASIANSVETKRDSDQIVEAISAEDIGKLPDLSIGESLARLPGLAGQRVDGRAQVIAIRGLSPDFAGTLLNGREQVSTGDNRGVEYDQYPAELINAATVYKTPDATLVGQGLSGTVNLQTIRPLALDGRKLVVTGRREYNSLGRQNAGGKDGGYRASFSYIDQYFDRRLGLAIGVARLDSPFQEKHYKAWWWNNPALQGTAVPGLPADATSLQGAEFWARSKKQVRDGLIATLEFKPSERLHSTLDLYYSKFNQSETVRGLMWPQDPGTGNGVYYTGAGTSNVGGDALVTDGVVHNLRPVVRNDHNKRSDWLYSAGWNTQWNFGEGWSLTGDLSYSRGRRKQSLVETYAGRSALDSMAFQLPAGSSDFARFTPGLDYQDPAAVQLGDPARWGHDGRVEFPRQDDEIKNLRLQLRRDFTSGPFSAIDLGYNYIRREKRKSSSVYYAYLRDGRAPLALDPDLLLAPTALGFSGIPGVLAYDAPAALGRYYTLSAEPSTDDLKKDFSVAEKIGTAYAMLEIGTELGSFASLRGNLGAQLVHTEQSSDAFNIDPLSNTVSGSVRRGARYHDLLPSLNLVADFGEGRLIRFGAAKTLARPRIDDLRAAASASVSTTAPSLWSGSGGNPRLKPWRARSLDLSFEKYFGKTSYVALALFYKKLDTYVYTQTVDFDFTGFPNTSGVTPVSTIGTFSTPQNGNGGRLRGAEFSTSLEGGLLHPALEGFGMQFSASYTDSSIQPNGPDGGKTLTLPGLSKKVANLTLYYERHGFAARISQRYRSDFRGEITSLFAQRSYTRILADRQTDLQLSYDFGPQSPLKRWSAIFQVNNLTNSPYRTVQDGNFAGGATAPQEYDLYGRQYLLGFAYKFE